MSKATNTPSKNDGENKKRTSFVLRTEIQRKLNFIKAVDGIEITDIVDAALTKYITEWEKKNGPITLK